MTDNFDYYCMTISLFTQTQWVMVTKMTCVWFCLLSSKIIPKECVGVCKGDFPLSEL